MEEDTHLGRVLAVVDHDAIAVDEVLLLSHLLRPEQQSTEYVLVLKSGGGMEGKCREALSVVEEPTSSLASWSDLIVFLGTTST